MPFVRAAVEPAAVVHIDGRKGDDELSKYGYLQGQTICSATPDPAYVVLPGVHRLAALLKCKRVQLGTNQRTVRARIMALHTDPSPYAKMIGGKHQGH